MSDEWRILFQNFQNFKTYSYYVFGNQDIPSSYMPPLYFIFIYINKILSFEKINFLYLIYFNQIIISSFIFYLFYKLCQNFFNERFSCFWRYYIFSFSINSLWQWFDIISLSTIIFYLLFLNLFLRIFTNDLNRKNLLFLVNYKRSYIDIKESF